MKPKILVVGGGTTFNSYAEYLAHLKNKEIDLEKLRARRDWKDNLQEALGNSFEVFVPRMPNPVNARYQEWAIWFKRILDILPGDLILVGHSLGGIFLAKYLAENEVAHKIRATILVAAPFNDENLEETLADFNLEKAFLPNFVRQAGEIYLFFSQDDPVVPFTEQTKWKKALGKVKIFTLAGRGHFKTESFPELVGLIRSLKVV